MNPARSLGPAIVSGQLSTVWMYILAPLLGASVATGIAWFVHGGTDTTEKKAARGEQ